MAEIEVGNLVAKISIEDSGLEKSMAEISRQMKLVDSEFKKASAGVKDFGSTSDQLRTKADFLTKQLGLQQQRVNKLNEEFQKSVKEKGEDAVATQKLATKLNQAQAEYNRLEAELKQTNAEITLQASAWTKLSNVLTTTGAKLKTAGTALTETGKSLTLTLTAPLAAVGGLATKASIDFESAFAGVRKTVDATEAEFAHFNRGMRQMAKDIPATATEIARVGEAAGQLGIQKEAILGFTRTMVDLGVATNMSSDEAAMALARLATITQMPQSEFDRLGATIVDLGNNLAATESEIVEMGLRIAGAGATVGMTEHQILAFAGSLAAVGINAEAGGTAFSKLMITIANEVAMGGEKLSGFAQVAGMSAADFSKAFKDDAATAIVSFIEGLGNINKAGGNTFAVIEDLGLSEIRLRDALLRASGAGDVMRKSLEIGNKAWHENVALTNEASERYKTAESQLQIFRNRINDIGITLGNALVPALLKLLESLQPLINLIARAAEWFAGLNDGTRAVVIAIVALVAAIGPLLVIFGTMLSSIGTIVTTLGSLSAAVAAAGGVMAVLTRAVGFAVPAIRALGAALVWLVANPVGAAITAIGLLVAGIAALVGFLKKDSIPAVQTFGEQAEVSVGRATGSFKKFRSEAEGALKDTAKAAGAQGTAIGDNIASGVGKGTKKAKDTAAADMKEMVERMKQEVDRSAAELNKLGDAIVTALKKQYEEAEKAQTKALDERVEEEKKTSEQIIKQYEKEKDEKLKSIDKQTDAEKKASDERLKIYDREYTEKLKLVDEEAYQQIKALQAQIDAIDDQTEAEEKAAREQEYQARIAELNKQLAAAETAEEREKIQKDLNKAIADHERQQLLEQRKNQKDALRDQIDAVKEAQTAKKEQLKQELEAQKEAEKDRLTIVQDGLKEQKESLKEHYDGLKEEEKNRLTDVQTNLEKEKTAIKEYYAELTKQENLQAEARKMVIEQNNEEIIKLLESYNPKWQDAGQSFADSFANGLNSEKQSMQDAIQSTLDLAPVIDKQVAELDRMQAKLKELETAAKGSGDIGGGGGLSGLALDFDNAVMSAGDFADALNNVVGPAMDSAGEGAKRISDESIAAFIGLQDQAMVALNQLYWSGKEVTEEMAEDIADTYAAMGNEILSSLDANHSEQLQSLQNFFASTSELTEEEKNAMLEKLNEKHKNERQEIESGQRRIFEILSNALNEQRALTQAEYDEINGIQRTFTSAANEIFSGHEIKQKALLERMKTEASTITANQAAEVAKNSAKQRDDAIQAAEEQYKKVTEEIIRQRDELGTITKEQADKLIEEAKRQRDESVKNAEDMHEKVVEEAKKQAKEHVHEIDWETGEVLSKWETFKNKTAAKWDEMKTTMANAWNDMWSDAKRKVDNIKSDAINLFIEMKNGIKEKMEEAKQWVSDIWTQTTDFFSSIDLREIGINAVQGLIDGIGSMATALWDKVKSVASGIGNSIKETLDIRSPSRVTMKLGEYTGEGLALGLENSIADIKRKAAAMSAAAMPALKDISMPGVKGGYSGTSGTATASAVNLKFDFANMFAGSNISVRSDQDLETLAIMISKRINEQAQQAYRGVGGATL